MRMTSRVTGWSTQPSSTRGTRSGQAFSVVDIPSAAQAGWWAGGCTGAAVARGGAAGLGCCEGKYRGRSAPRSRGAGSGEESGEEGGAGEAGVEGGEDGGLWLVRHCGNTWEMQGSPLRLCFAKAPVEMTEFWDSTDIDISKPLWSEVIWLIGCRWRCRGR